MYLGEVSKCLSVNDFVFPVLLRQAGGSACPAAGATERHGDLGRRVVPRSRSQALELCASHEDQKLPLHVSFVPLQHAGSLCAV